MRVVLARGFGWIALGSLGLALATAVAGPWGALNNLRYPLLAAALAYGAACWLSAGLWQRVRLEGALNSAYFPWSLALGAALVFVRIKLLQWPAGQISGIDFSHIDYAVWGTTQGHFMGTSLVPPQPTYLNFFGNHYSPILFVHVFARWLVDSPLSSLVVHALSLAAPIPLLHALAHKLVDRFTASLLTLNYVFCGAVASTLQFDMHMESFYPLALTLLFWGLYSQRAWLWLGTLLTLSIKEDSGVYLFPAFFWLAYFVPTRRKDCLALALLTGATTVITLKVLMPMHQPVMAGAPYYMPMWAKYGRSFGEVATQMLTHPHWVLWDVVSNKDLYKNLLAWGFLPLGSPLGALALPNVVVASTAYGVQRSFGLYYGIALVPIFFLATAATLARVRRPRLGAVIVLALGSFLGGSYLRFQAPLPYFAEIEAAALRVNALGEERTFVQSGLVPFLPYSRKWERLDSVTQIPAPGKNFVVLFDGLAQDSLEIPFAGMDAELRRRGYRAVETSGRLRVYGP